MQLRDLDLPIINDNWHVSLEHQRMSALGVEFCEAWARMSEDVDEFHRSLLARLVWIFEAYLNITSQRVPDQFCAETFSAYDARFEELLGAIYSKHFSVWRSGRQCEFARTLMKAREGLANAMEVSLTWRHVLSSATVSPQIQRLVSRVEALDLDPDKVTQWRGWACQTKANSKRLTYLPLTPILEKLGPEFAFPLYDLCKTYTTTRRRCDLSGVRCMARFVAEMKEPFRAEQLRDPAFTEKFFCELYEFYLQAGYRDGEGSTVARLVSIWRGGITNFFEQVVFPSGLIAPPEAGLPTPRNINVRGETTNVVETESGVVHFKLLTPVPLEVTDDEAMEIIFERVESDLDKVKRWAWHEVCRVASLLDRRNRLAATGTVRSVGAVGQNGKAIGSTDWGHPDHLKNGAATFVAMGYPCYFNGSGLSSVLFPAPRKKWAEELAIPTASTLVAHCAVIIAEHPNVTPAFLEQFILYDKNGKLAGVVGADGASIFSGAKLRRGPNLAAQDIVLTERSAFAVDQIRLLTEPLRHFLRGRGDDAWRYLLLTSGVSFGYPHRMRKLTARTSAPDALKTLARSLANALSLSDGEATDLAERFSLSAMRASAGVLVYFKSKSLHEMANALGHARYDIQLLDRYLPKALRQFFEDRWIRIFQMGVIVQALEGSKYRLAASGFKTIDELDRFLLNHALRRPTKNGRVAHDRSAGGITIEQREVVFGLNEEILTTLLSLKMAQDEGRPLLPKARYWAEIAGDLIPYIQTAGTARPDVQTYLERARAMAAPQLVAGIAYAQ